VPERSRERELAGSTDMVPVEGTVDVIAHETVPVLHRQAHLGHSQEQCALGLSNVERPAR
jgi:hypothetical protein